MSKTLVFCLDALCSCDIAEMRKMPHFGRILERGSYVRKIEPVWPALTYCCHVSMVTGCYVDRHGVANNEKMQRGGSLGQPWYAKKSDVKVPTVLDYAKQHGLTTCSISWPVSGGADYDMNLPMIIPYGYQGWDPTPWLKGMATQELLDRYFYKHGRYLKGKDRSLDLFTMAMALDILQDYPQPDLMLIKMCDLDGCRHTYGVHSEQAKEQLRKHDEEFGSILEALRRKGTLEQTNFVIVGDHGQTDITNAVHLNVLFKEKGLLRTNGDGTLQSYDALVHSAALTAYVELADPSNAQVKQQVRELLEQLKDDPEIQLAYVMDAQQAEETFRVKGDFDFIIESKLPICFGERWDLDSKFGPKYPGDHKIGAATHGGNPNREELTTMIVAGPDIQAGVVIERRPMVDEAPTIARLLGFSMPNTDGTAIEELLR